MEPFTQSHEQILVMNHWNKLVPNLTMGFTTKNGGESSESFASFNLGLHVNDQSDVVISNREKLAELLDMGLHHWVCSEQIHDNTITKVSKEDIGKGVFDYETSITGTDGIYTKDKNVLLTSCYADCVPLYFLEPNQNLIGVAHAGWKGTVKNIAGEMINRWINEEMVDVNDIRVAIGPSIEECCYVVDDYVLKFVNDVLEPSDSRPYRQVEKGQYALNLKMLNKQLLIKAGIQPEHILESSYCTSCREDLFFSHRRDNGKTGRMLSFIGING